MKLIANTGVNLIRKVAFLLKFTIVWATLYLCYFVVDAFAEDFDG